MNPPQPSITIFMFPPYSFRIYNTQLKLSKEVYIALRKFFYLLMQYGSEFLAIGIMMFGVRNTLLRHQTDVDRFPSKGFTKY